MRARILIFSLVITIISIILFSLASAQVYYSSTVDESEIYLAVYMNMYDPDVYDADNDGAVALSEVLGGARVTFITADGEVLGDSEEADITESHKDRPEFVDAVANGEGYSVRSSETLGENMVYYCSATDDADLFVRIAVAIPSEWGIFVKTLPTTAMYIALDIILCVIIAFVATYFILKPVTELARNAGSSGQVTVKYSVLKPIADILNERNRNIERQMKEIVAEKEQVEKARMSKDEFISNITHEMNTPLTAISGYAELLKGGALTEEQKNTAYDVIAAQSERLTSLIACIINYNEIDSDELPSGEVNLSDVVRETIEISLPEAKVNQIEVYSSIEDNVVVVSRAELCREAVGNLLRNAIRYNVPGGEVHVTLTHDSFTVSDTGIGISEENLDRIFDRFFTVDKSHGGKNGGFGLGLAAVKKICGMYGWKIKVESKVGEGSTFTIDF